MENNAGNLQLSLRTPQTPNIIYAIRLPRPYLGQLSTVTRHFANKPKHS